jgi:hypothetical protein
MRWLDKVIEPLHDLPEEQKERLRAALALTKGPDSISIMKDVCRLEDHEGLAVLRWAPQSSCGLGLRRAALRPQHPEQPLPGRQSLAKRLGQ